MTVSAASPLSLNTPKIDRDVAVFITKSGEKTVKTHVSSILSKLQLADRTQAALYAVRERLVEIE